MASWRLTPSVGQGHIKSPHYRVEASEITSVLPIVIVMLLGDVLRNTKNASYDRPRALITGGTSGIGAAFAKRLAQEGFDLILHGRRQKELVERAKNLERTHGTSVESIIAELSRSEEMKKVEERINGLERLDLLINNVGYWEPGVFWQHSAERLQSMIMVHDVAPARFIRAALPRMLERGKGDIINVPSVGAYFNMITMENYGATKAYLISFTESLHVALMGTGIRVQALVPGMTATEFHSRLGADFTVEPGKQRRPEEVVEQSLRALRKGRVLCIPGFRSQLLVRLTAVLPRSVYYRMMKAMGEKVKKTWDEIGEARAS